MSARHQSDRRPGMLALLGFALLALTGFILWAALRETATEKRIHQILAELRASGAPLSAADLARLFPDPEPERDALILFGPAFNLATNATYRGNAPFISSRELPGRGTNMDEDLREATRRFCQGTAGLMAALPTNVPAGTRFPSHWDEGFQSTRPGNFVAIRYLAQALAIHAVDAAEDRDAEASAKILEQAFVFSRTINYEQSLVSHMIHHACVNLAAAAATRALNRVSFSDQQLQELARSLESEPDAGITNLWITERCLGIWAFQSVKAGASLDAIMYPNRTPRSFLTRLWERIKQRKRSYTDEDFLRYLELIPRHLKAVRQPALVAEVRCGTLQADYDRLQTSQIGEAILPDMRRYVGHRATAHATRASLCTAFALERYRLAHQGSLPETLAELVPAFLEVVPPDPFDGQPLRYRKLERGYVVYSLGPHGVDVGGRELSPSNQSSNYNVGITVER